MISRAVYGGFVTTLAAVLPQARHGNSAVKLGRSCFVDSAMLYAPHRAVGSDRGASNCRPVCRLDSVRPTLALSCEALRDLASAVLRQLQRLVRRRHRGRP